MTSPSRQVTSAPSLTDGVVVLDGLRPDDAPSLVACYDAAVAWAWFDAQPMTLERAQREVANSTAKWRRASLFRRFAIRRAGNPDIAGTLQLHPKPTDGSVLDLWLCLASRGQGVGKRAARLALAYGFHEMAVAWVEVEVRPENVASRALALAVGFEPIEGQWRQLHRNGPFIEPYRLTVERWRALKAGA